MDPKHETGIDNIDDLVAQLDLPPEEGAPEIIVADETEDLTDEIIGETPIDDMVAAASVADEELVQALQADEIAAAKAEAYASQESTVTVSSMEPTPVAPVKRGKKGVSVAAPADPSAPAKRVSTGKRVSTADMKASEALAHKITDSPANYVLEVGDALLTPEELSAKRDEFFKVADTLAKKVKEKAVNLFSWAINGETLSVYTETALTLLVGKGTLTSAEIRNAYQAKGHTVGTANAQAGQMLQLFQALRIANKTPAGLEVNPDSTLVAKFKSVNAGA